MAHDQPPTRIGHADDLGEEDLALVALEERQHHPTARTYVIIGIILAIITGLEVYVYNVEVDVVHENLAFILLVLSACKFLLVISFFMHLRFDNRLFTAFFGFGLVVAGSIVSALLLLQRIHPYPPAGS